MHQVLSPMETAILRECFQSRSIDALVKATGCVRSDVLRVLKTQVDKGSLRKRSIPISNLRVIEGTLHRTKTSRMQYSLTPLGQVALALSPASIAVLSDFS